MPLDKTETDEIAQLKETYNGAWDSIDPENVARMRLQNRFKTGLEIAQYTADIMRADMDAYDADSSQYTQSLGCWHGFIAQQKMIAIKKHFGTTKRKYLYLSGWMVAALRSEFGPLPDQSMHEKTSVSDTIEELYTFLRQADARELGGLFRELDAAPVPAKPAIQAKIDNFETHVVPIIADIDAGFGNPEATYLLANFYNLYGWQFLYETYFYHFIRKDNRHNFSVYFYYIYLNFENVSVIKSILTFVPQFVLLIISGIKFYKDLPFCIFIQTFIFVTFNKVVTAQYFIWFIPMIPIIFENNLLFTEKKK